MMPGEMWTYLCIVSDLLDLERRAPCDNAFRLSLFSDVASVTATAIQVVQPSDYTGHQPLAKRAVGTRSVKYTTGRQAAPLLSAEAGLCMHEQFHSHALSKSGPAWLQHLEIRR
jgi:hypothetical protein